MLDKGLFRIVRVISLIRLQNSLLFSAYFILSICSRVLSLILTLISIVFLLFGFPFCLSFPLIGFLDSLFGFLYIQNYEQTPTCFSRCKIMSDRIMFINRILDKLRCCDAFCLGDAKKSSFYTLPSLAFSINVKVIYQIK